ncbi:hypothetical protein LMG29739_03995 [Paraburkholderia solisilvae]|uniref:Uncharacterized protein n=1 Tax=Paraburkholderia solisilvae TaxID=624376 RepID=A0A6J5EC95_9BURK|nr:hypothetical protein LMG29739_03995 [Paraburkholderia solisilvae]
MRFAFFETGREYGPFPVSLHIKRPATNPFFLLSAN